MVMLILQWNSAMPQIYWMCVFLLEKGASVVRVRLQSTDLRPLCGCSTVWVNVWYLGLNSWILLGFGHKLFIFFNSLYSPSTSQIEACTHLMDYFNLLIQLSPHFKASDSGYLFRLFADADSGNTDIQSPPKVLELQFNFLCVCCMLKIFSFRFPWKIDITQLIRIPAFV